MLIVDDNATNRYILTLQAQSWGMLPRAAARPSEALEWIRLGDPFDAGILDMQMPEMDGYEATRRIRKDARFTSLPIIALTAKAMKGDRERCLEAGASDYLPKPVDIGKLLALLGSLMKTASEPRGVT